MANLTFNIDDDTKEIAREFIRAIKGLTAAIGAFHSVIKTDRIETEVIHIKSEGSDKPIAKFVPGEGSSLGNFSDGND